MSQSAAHHLGGRNTFTKLKNTSALLNINKANYVTFESRGSQILESLSEIYSVETYLPAHNRSL